MAGTPLPASGLGCPQRQPCSGCAAPHRRGGGGGSQEPPSVCDRCEQAPRGQADMPACDVPRGKG